MTDDDLDALIDDDERKLELERRFRELEREQEIARMKSRGGRSPAAGPTAAGEGDPSGPPDDLAADKDALDGEQPERFVLLLCPHCGAKNRTGLARLRQSLPRCGGCKASLSFDL